MYFNKDEIFKVISFNVRELVSVIEIESEGQIYLKAWTGVYTSATPEISLGKVGKLVLVSSSVGRNFIWKYIDNCLDVDDAREYASKLVNRRKIPYGVNIWENINEAMTHREVEKRVKETIQRFN